MLDVGVRTRIEAANAAVVLPAHDERRRTALADLEDLGISLRLALVVPPDHEPITGSGAQV